MISCCASSVPLRAIWAGYTANDFTSAGFGKAANSVWTGSDFATSPAESRPPEPRRATRAIRTDQRVCLPFIVATPLDFLVGQNRQCSYCERPGQGMYFFSGWRAPAPAPLGLFWGGNF